MSSAGASCPECHSVAVRPSRRSYVSDAEKTEGGTRAFWRCTHCGVRFLGPAVPDSYLSPRQKARAGRGKRHRHSTSRRLELRRSLQQWLVPVVALLVTLAVMYLIDTRERTPPPIPAPAKQPRSR